MDQSLLDRAAEHFGHPVTWDGHSTGHAHIDTWLLRQEFDAHTHPTPYGRSYDEAYLAPVPRFAVGDFAVDRRPCEYVRVQSRSWDGHEWSYTLASANGLPYTRYGSELSPID